MLNCLFWVPFKYLGLELLSYAIKIEYYNTPNKPIKYPDVQMTLSGVTTLPGKNKSGILHRFITYTAKTRSDPCKANEHWC